MSIKLKILGLGVLAVMATSAFSVVNASATVSGHFSSQATEHHLILKGTDAYKSGHELIFRETGAASGGISCTDSEYHGTLSGAPVTSTQEISLTPTYTKCATAVDGAVWGEVSVHHEAGCGTNVYKFTSRTPHGLGTVHIECVVTITHPNCTIKIPKQTPSGGISYTTDEAVSPHAITANVAVTNIVGNYEGGICIFLGTNHTFTMNGSVTMWGEDTKGNRVGVTAT